ncbi:hypothetical protein HDU96_000444 [Phlyctochytrium bullatum]|nr:hypothetical protein HDU96_000444 [Phlyctochytrium bullatum]
MAPAAVSSSHTMPAASAKKPVSAKTPPSLPKESGKPLAKSSTGSKPASTVSLRKANATQSTAKLSQPGSKVQSTETDADHLPSTPQTGSKVSIADRSDAKKKAIKAATAHGSKSSLASAKKIYSAGPSPAAGSRHGSTARLASKSTTVSTTSLKPQGPATGSKAGSRAQLHKSPAAAAAAASAKSRASAAASATQPLPDWAVAVQQELSTLGPFVLKDGCQHPKSPGQLLRFVSWASKSILTVCRFGCSEALTTEGGSRRRVVAVSHVWGADVCRLAVPGIPWGVPLGSAKSLAEAFAGCRRDDLHWLDVLCIDQTSTDELAVATHHMSEVFGAADLVNLWLPTCEAPWPVLGILAEEKLRTHAEGTGTLLPQEVASALQGTTSAAAKVAEYLREFDFKGAKSVEEKIEVQKDALEGLVSAAKFSQWFQRVWTTQELVLAPQLAFHHIQIDVKLLLHWIQDFMASLPANVTWTKAAKAELSAQMLNSLLLKQELLQHRQSSSSTPVPLQALYDAIAYRYCRFQRDKVITIGPLLRQTLDLPAYDPADASKALAERLWHHVVRTWVQAGELSVVSVIAPNNRGRTTGLWHPPICPPGLTRCPAFQPRDKPVVEPQYILSPPSSDAGPATLHRVRMVPVPVMWFPRITLTAIMGGVGMIADTLGAGLRGIEYASRHLERAFETGGEGMGCGRVGGAAALAWVGELDAKGGEEGGEGGPEMCMGVVRMAWPEGLEATREGLARLRLYGWLGDGEAAWWEEGTEGFKTVRHPGLVGVAWVDLENVAEEELKGFPVVDVEIP